MAAKKNDKMFSSFFDESGQSPEQASESHTKRKKGRKKKKDKDTQEQHSTFFDDMPQEMDDDLSGSFYDTPESKSEEDFQEDMYEHKPHRKAAKDHMNSILHLFGFTWWEFLIVLCEVALIVLTILYFMGLFTPF
ncbi:MAG: hypothetical protein ACQESE_00290 [Nanobdellota archaeon]